jgi:hypothetical protein
MNTGPTERAPKASLPIISVEDAFVMRAARGEASFAETLIWLHVAEVKARRAAKRIAEELPR